MTRANKLWHSCHSARNNPQLRLQQQKETSPESAAKISAGRKLAREREADECARQDV